MSESRQRIDESQSDVLPATDSPACYLLGWCVRWLELFFHLASATRSASARGHADSGHAEITLVRQTKRAVPRPRRRCDKLIISARRSRETRGTTAERSPRGTHRCARFRNSRDTCPSPPPRHGGHCRAREIPGVPLVEDKIAVSMGFRDAFRRAEQRHR